jgi:hypothetical protein
MDTQTFQNIIVIVSLTPIALLVIIGFLFSTIKGLKLQLKEANDKLIKQKEKEKSFLKFYIGSKALLNDYQLTHTPSTGKKTEFSVDYEVEVVDISETEIKVNAIDFVGNDSFSRDPQNKSGIISFMKNRWISKKEAQLIMDESHNRQVKLEELGI